jgi:hypothetical protein
VQRDQVTISIDPAVREAVREIANQERRTLSAQISHFVATHRYDRHLAVAVQQAGSTGPNCRDPENHLPWRFAMVVG